MEYADVSIKSNYFLMSFLSSMEYTNVSMKYNYFLMSFLFFVRFAGHVVTPLSTTIKRQSNTMSCTEYLAKQPKAN